MSDKPAATLAPSTAPNPLLRALMKSEVDRVVGIVAIVPFVYFGYYRYTHMPFGIPLVCFCINVIAFIAPMVVRRVPQRITANPWFWLLTFVETYWPLLTLGFLEVGVSLISHAVADSLAILSVVLTLWARLTLGRNIGLVPAQREIVTSGPYRFVRHPIYTAIFVSTLAVILQTYTPLNFSLFSLGIFWFLLKSVAEEHFLRLDAGYNAYMRQVRFRWIPGLA